MCRLMGYEWAKVVLGMHTGATGKPKQWSSWQILPPTAYLNGWTAVGAVRWRVSRDGRLQLQGAVVPGTWSVYGASDTPGLQLPAGLTDIESFRVVCVAANGTANVLVNGGQLYFYGGSAAFVDISNIQIIINKP
jgi:hypothetical protein